MDRSFAPIRRTLAAFACAAAVCGTALAQTEGSLTTAAADGIPAGKYKECHGYVRHVSANNLKVHCIDGNASDQSFLFVPKYVTTRNGASVQISSVKPETTVHVYYTQTLGIKKAYRVIVADTDGVVKGGAHS